MPNNRHPEQNGGSLNDDDARVPWSRLRAIIYESSTIPSSFAFGAFMAAPVGIIAIGDDGALQRVGVEWFLIGLAIYVVGAVLFLLSLGAFVLFAPLKVVHHINREVYVERSRSDWHALPTKLQEQAGGIDSWISARRINWNSTNLSWGPFRWALLVTVCVSILCLCLSGLAFLRALLEFLLAMRPLNISLCNI